LMAQRIRALAAMRKTFVSDVVKDGMKQYLDGQKG